ncbi:hypothetical protein Y032_0022g525 [Ancylostoma ceylanicum]|uniref:Uncharacterized protein n=1 Tax=Ancylostoma ceylanicum TaxID=53326 RepID=A0A016UYH7_9BILA|nr:hypothetical protein Y032_0022g525 [Ancylostoma ceylanicum]
MDEGNVIFSSAIHGYCFGVEDFAVIYAERLQIPKAELNAALFGDFYISGGKIKGDAASRGRKTLFSQLILEPLWALHHCGLVANDLPKLIELAGKLGVQIKSRRVLDAFDEAVRTWLPLSQACFRACARAPSARTAFHNKYRMQYLLGNKKEHILSNAIEECLPSGITVVLVVKLIRMEGRKFAICRVFSGKIRTGEELYLVGRKVTHTSTVIRLRSYEAGKSETVIFESTCLAIFSWVARAESGERGTYTTAKFLSAMSGEPLA